jgi:predicted transcriptional regulator
MRILNKEDSMTIDEYLHKYNMTGKEFADRVGIAPQTLVRYKKGLKPSLRIAKRIVKATRVRREEDHGLISEVTLKDLGWDETSK